MLVNPINTVDSKYLRNIPTSPAKYNSVLNQAIELSGYEAARAMFARNNVSFRNLAMPVEVTDKYNKKIEGQDHLDLTNIHVYEYPDTNLQVFVDKSNLNTTSQIKFSILNTNTLKTNPMYNNLLYQILKPAIYKINPEIIFFGGDEQVTYFTTLEKDKVVRINNAIFNMNYDENDLENAKKNLITHINSEQYKNRNVNIKYLYPKETLYDLDTFEQKINKVTLEDLKEYHKDFLNNSCATISVVMSDKDFNDRKLWKIFNNDINVKFKKNGEINNKDINFLQNNIIHIEENNNISSNVEMDYCYFVEDEKENIIASMISDIISTSGMFKFKDYYASTNGYYDNPINIKSNKDLRDDCLYYKFEFCEKNPNVKNLIQEFKDNLQKLYDSDLDIDINKWKDVYKDDFKYEYETCKGLKKLSFLSKYDNDIFMIYEIIDSITQNDLKNQMKKYLIDQEPIVHVKKEILDSERV